MEILPGERTKPYEIHLSGFNQGLGW